MKYRALTGPVGPLTIFEDGDALTVLEFGRAPGGESSPLLDEAVRQLEAYFDGRLQAFDLPLAPVGTEFQKAVWSEMQCIPLGETRSYGDLARALASSARAVGGACGRNPIPIIIPCHRVLGADGRPGGYSGGDGLATKAILLRLEGRDVTWA